VTIADMVADLRAPTPSAAAEMLVPDLDEEHLHLQQLRYTLIQKMFQLTDNRQELLRQTGNRLLAQHPKRVINNRQQRGDETELRLQRAMLHRLQNTSSELHNLYSRLHNRSPGYTVERQRARLEQMTLRLSNAIHSKIGKHASRWQETTRALDAVSPLATLSRGYSIVRTPEQEVVTSADQVGRGDEIEAMLAEGKLLCRVKQVISLKSQS